MIAAFALIKLRDIFKTTHNSRYFVKRGVINWSGFDFERHKFAASIQVDEMSPGLEMPAMSMSIEIATTITEQSSIEPGIDDDVIESMTEDAMAALDEWQRAKLPNGDAYITKLDRRGIRVVEFHDVTLRVQGVIVSVNVST